MPNSSILFSSICVQEIFSAPNEERENLTHTGHIEKKGIQRKELNKLAKDAGLLEKLSEEIVKIHFIFTKSHKGEDVIQSHSRSRLEETRLIKVHFHFALKYLISVTDIFFRLSLGNMLRYFFMLNFSLNIYPSHSFERFNYFHKSCLTDKCM